MGAQRHQSAEVACAARTSKRGFILHRAIGTDLDHPGATRWPASRDESKDRHVLDPVAQTQWRPSQLIRNNVLVTAIACEPGPAITIEHHTVGNPGIRQVAGVMVFSRISHSRATLHGRGCLLPRLRRRRRWAVADSETLRDGRRLRWSRGNGGSTLAQTPEGVWGQQATDQSHPGTTPTGPVHGTDSCRRAR